jgi:hypothetical protein
MICCVDGVDVATGLVVGALVGTGAVVGTLAIPAGRAI